MSGGLQWNCCKPPVFLFVFFFIRYILRLVLLFAVLNPKKKIGNLLVAQTQFPQTKN